ncbi:MAG: OsmC family peroxiredoxin [Gemmataceae bacterium]|nr:OsmC family peroxiredoxin [Gemmataceae bacterium]
MQREHRYLVQVEWTGNLGQGTSGYHAYSRDHQISCKGKAIISGSSDPVFCGDPARYNPEDLLVSSLSACHMLWYLHLCAEAGVRVLAYQDQAEGVMKETAGESGKFQKVTLKPEVLLAHEMDSIKARELHERAHALCFIANSVNFPVECEPLIKVESRPI